MLSLTPQCGICGQPLLSSDLTSDPSQHFCGLELNGAAIVQPVVVSARKVDSSLVAPESSARSSLSADDGEAGRGGSHHLAPSTPHNPLDLAEIGRLYMENAALRGMRIPTLMMPSTSDTFSTPRYTPAVAGQPVMTKQVAMANGERVMVEVAVHAK
ncbi:hypothetical protein B0A55_07065 [Friedmanniomyces simplex]|uniref:Uncharacterized protein n=1 Tax=Friedmanniomyces simplex TaxID=329884 RepID=A0A4U0X546_9PEZI|nr:hypothetical protein B0A55_07065 [Friedmanniomyces simplex]